MDYSAFWNKVKEKGIEIGLEENYFTHFNDNDNTSCKISNTGLKRCSYVFELAEDSGCFIEVNHSNASWNKKVYDMVFSCKEELEKTIGVPMSFDEAELKFGISKHPKDHTIQFSTETTSEEDLIVHLIRCFYLMIEEVDHVVRNAMEEVY